MFAQDNEVLANHARVQRHPSRTAEKKHWVLQAEDSVAMTKSERLARVLAGGTTRIPLFGGAGRSQPTSQRARGLASGRARLRGTLCKRVCSARHRSNCWEWIGVCA